MKIVRGAIRIDVDSLGNATISTHGWAFALQVEAADVDNLASAVAELLSKRGRPLEPLPPEATGYKYECDCGATDGGVHKPTCPARRTFLDR